MSTSLGAVGADHAHHSILIPARHLDAPRIAADFAVLDEAAADVGFDEDLQILAAKRACNHEFVWHLRDRFPRSRTTAEHQDGLVATSALRRNVRLIDTSADSAAASMPY